ncbi:AAA family ATPase, partial [Clostridium sp. MCC353]|uniref:AAA family ATPase n=1 Tax=Clostridium sp. MCC353 TaxID=2592646 RepID=UPI001C0371BC
MKLLFLWIKNYKNTIINQSFNISNAYHINYDVECNELYISKNREYVEGFYGKNILDITAIVGNNGAGKTTFTRFIYDYCEGVHPCNIDKEYITDDSYQITVYEKEGNPGEIILQYFLVDDPIINNPENLSIDIINLKNINGIKFLNAEHAHDITTVYFTNAFEINNVLNNQGFSEFSSFGVHKSLCYTPMLSLQRAYTELKKHYGADKISDGMIFDVINRYAQNMTTDFKASYATATAYNYLIATRYFPGAIVNILPVMSDFQLSITEFGEYTKCRRDFFKQSPFDQTVIFIRKNIYEHLHQKFSQGYWGQIYINILCEIVLFLNKFNSGFLNINFEVLKNENLKLNTEQSFEIILGQIEDTAENKPKKELIRRIRNTERIDLDIIREFSELKDENMKILQESRWYRQVKNFLTDYDVIKDIEINQTINYGFVQLIDLIINNYNNIDTVYRRMFRIIPQAMSSGEVAMINIFATLYKALTRNTSGSILLIIDEIDAFLHPKWQQDILTHITEWINKSKQFDNKKVQLVLASHSPIILSDIPVDNIIYLEKLCKVVVGEQLTFGANIGSLFYDSFFMKEGSIGKIAKREIQWVINNLDNMNLTIDERKRLVYIINNVGDKFLRE